MPNLYVLGGNGTTYTVIVHVAIPNVNNLVSVNYRTALINSGIPGAGNTSLPVGNGPGQISPADYQSVLSGAIFEVATTFTTSVLTGDAFATAIAGFATAIQTETIASLQAQLQHFGYTN